MAGCLSGNDLNAFATRRRHTWRMWNFALDCPGHLLGQKFCVTRLAVCVLFAVVVAVIVVVSGLKVVCIRA